MANLNRQRKLQRPRREAEGSSEAEETTEIEEEAKELAKKRKPIVRIKRKMPLNFYFLLSFFRSKFLCVSVLLLKSLPSSIQHYWIWMKW